MAFQIQQVMKWKQSWSHTCVIEGNWSDSADNCGIKKFPANTDLVLWPIHYVSGVRTSVGYPRHALG